MTAVLDSRLATAGLLLSLLTALPACGPTIQPETDDSLASIELEPVLERALAFVEAPGLIVGVRRGDETRIATAGVADLDSGRPMAAGDPYFLGSVTKTYTAALVLHLVEAGVLDLDQPLADLLPEFPGAEGISLRQLLQHESGLADFAVWAYFRPNREEMLELLKRHWTVDEMLAGAAALEPDFEPGSRWSYSNTNYLVLGAVIEAFDGGTLAGETRERLLEPLGLETTWLNNWEPAAADLPITGYLGPLPFWPHGEMFGELGSTTAIDQGNMEWGAGGMVSTATEATVFLDALLGAEILTEASLAEMLDWIETPALGSPSPETPADLSSGYGMGIARQQRPGYTMIGHGGLFNGHTAGLWRLEECGTTVAFYANRGFVDARWIMDRLAEALGCVGDLED